MAVKIRLARHGATKKPYYRIVVTDSDNKPTDSATTVAFVTAFGGGTLRPKTRPADA